MNHLTHLLRALRTALLFCVFVATKPAWSQPLTFEFSGTISDLVLITGTWQHLPTNRADWNGTSVTGRITMSLDEAVASSFNSPQFSQYATTSAHPYADWLKFSVVNPDGSLVTVADASSPSPLPMAEGNDALTYLVDNDREGGFYAQRTFDNGRSYPRQSISLWLSGLGDDGALLTSSADYRNVVIDPRYATRTNYGYLRSFSAAGEYQYAFTINSLKRVMATIPLGGSWGLAVFALAGFCGSVRLRRARELCSVQQKSHATAWPFGDNRKGRGSEVRFQQQAGYALVGVKGV